MEPDWSIYNDAVMRDAVDYAANALVKQNPDIYLDKDDLTQEAWILLASRAEEARDQEAKGYLKAWLCRKLFSAAVETEASRAKKTVGVLREAGE